MDWHHSSDCLYGNHPVGHIRSHIRKPQPGTLPRMGDSAYVPSRNRADIIPVFWTQHQNQSRNLKAHAPQTDAQGTYKASRYTKIAALQRKQAAREIRAIAYRRNIFSREQSGNFH